MVIARKGKQVKYEKIQNALKKYQPKDIREVYYLLDDLKFNLTNQEACDIAQQWQSEQTVLQKHNLGAFAQQEVTACVIL